MRARLRYRPKEVWVALTKLGTYRRMAHLWLSKTLPRSLGRAYQATKQIRNIHKHMPNKGVSLWRNPSQRAILSYMGTGIGISVSIVYCSVLSRRIIIYLLGISNNFGSASSPGMTLSKLTEGGSTEQVDRRLTWIRTTTKDSDNQRGTLLPPLAADPAGRVFHSVKRQQGNGPGFVAHHDESAFTVTAPCSLATHRFRAELGRPSLGTLWASIQLAEYPKGEAYPMIIGPFLIACIVIPVSLLSRGLKPWIAHWWNTHQPGVPPGHGDKLATGRPREVGELPRPYGVSSIPEEYRSRNQCLANMKYEGTMQLVEMRNEDSIQAIPNSSTGITYSVILSALLIPNEERPASTNMRAREFVRNLSDTVKAPLILLLTDLCIGFHPPHGWGIIIDTPSGHLGFVPNRYVIPRLVSTFPVISDTAFKHWIPRYLNRIPPPIAATHHATNE